MTCVMPTRTSLLTELVPFSMSPLARRKPAPPRRKPVLSSSITSSRELRLEPGLGAEARCQGVGDVREGAEDKRQSRWKEWESNDE